MLVTDTHVYFYTNVFSNWFTTAEIRPQFVDKETGIPWNNTEEVFMYYKAIHFGDVETAQKIIQHALQRLHPRGVKDLGRQVRDYDDKVWATVRYDYMVKANEWKFSQNYFFKSALLDTRGKILVEASPVDKIWGVGLGENDPLILDEKNWLGWNLLGKALMEVRRNLMS